MDDTRSLSHTKWNCKYHIVFAPKFRRKEAYGKLREDIGRILRELCNWKQVTIVEAEICLDHVHMLVEIPPKTSGAKYLSLDTHAVSLLFLKCEVRIFWCQNNSECAANLMR